MRRAVQKVDWPHEGNLKSPLHRPEHIWCSEIRVGESVLENKHKVKMIRKKRAHKIFRALQSDEVQSFCNLRGFVASPLNAHLYFQQMSACLDELEKPEYGWHFNGLAAPSTAATPPTVAAPPTHAAPPASRTCRPHLPATALVEVPAEVAGLITELADRLMKGLKLRSEGSSKEI